MIPQPWKKQYSTMQMQRMEEKLLAMNPMQEFEIGLNSKNGAFKVRLEVTEWEGCIAQSMLRIVAVDDGKVVCSGSAFSLVGKIIEFLYKRDNEMEA